jgi:hypothetical protein
MSVVAPHRCRRRRAHRSVPLLVGLAVLSIAAGSRSAPPADATAGQPGVSVAAHAAPVAASQAEHPGEAAAAVVPDHPQIAQSAEKAAPVRDFGVQHELAGYPWTNRSRAPPAR